MNIYWRMRFVIESTCNGHRMYILWNLQLFAVYILLYEQRHWKCCMHLPVYDLPRGFHYKEEFIPPVGHEIANDKLQTHLLDNCIYLGNITAFSTK